MEDKTLKEFDRKAMEIFMRPISANQMEEKENRFICCYELPHKGINFEIESNKTHLALSMFNGGKFETQVCLHDDDVERLILQLQKHLKRGENK